jgi:hypothetical protein
MNKNSFGLSLEEQLQPSSATLNAGSENKQNKIDAEKHRQNFYNFFCFFCRNKIIKGK